MEKLESRIVTNGIDRTSGGEGLIIYDLKGNKIKNIPSDHDIVPGALSMIEGMWNRSQVVSSINQLSDGRLLCAYQGNLIAIDIETEEFEHMRGKLANKGYGDIYCAKELSNGNIAYSLIAHRKDKEGQDRLISKLGIIELSNNNDRDVYEQEFRTSLGVKPVAIRPFPNDKLLFFEWDNDSKSYSPKMFDLYTNNTVKTERIEGKKLLDFTPLSNEKIAYVCGNGNWSPPSQLRTFDTRTAEDKLITKVNGPIFSIAPFSDGRLLCGGMFNRETYNLKDKFYSFFYRKSRERTLYEKGCDLAIIDPKTGDYNVLRKGIYRTVAPIF